MSCQVTQYKCKKCGTCIESNTNRKLVFCKCGKIGVDGTLATTRIIGDKNFLTVVKGEKEEFAYRIKHIKSGLYYTPYKYPKSASFTEKGKLYTRKPSISWVSYLVPVNECIIEKYKLENL
jgi:hypothetical protein